MNLSFHQEFNTCYIFLHRAELKLNVIYHIPSFLVSLNKIWICQFIFYLRQYAYLGFLVSADWRWFMKFPTIKLDRLRYHLYWVESIKQQFKKITFYNNDFIEDMDYIILVGFAILGSVSAVIHLNANLFEDEIQIFRDEGLGVTSIQVK